MKHPDNRRPGALLSSTRLPWLLKLLCTVWVLLLLPTYWQSTPLGLLWSCNMALVLTCAGLWLESSFLVSIATLGIVWWQLLWVFDFLIHLVVPQAIAWLRHPQTFVMNDEWLTGRCA